MGITRSTLYLCAALLLVGCATDQAVTPTAPAANTDDASTKLAEAATSISQSLTNLNAIEKASAPPINNKTLPYPTNYDMTQLASVDWSGPIEPLLQRIAGMCNYQVRVLGKRPAIPVLVALSAKETPLGYIVRDTNFQAGSKASVVVYPEIRIIELRYAKS